jgi:hypothetical protein
MGLLNGKLAAGVAAEEMIKIQPRSIVNGSSQYHPIYALSWRFRKDLKWAWYGGLSY